MVAQFLCTLRVCRFLACFLSISAALGAFSQASFGQKSVFVVPNQAWTDTGFAVASGEELGITASGLLDYNTNNTCSTFQACIVGPGGSDPGVPCTGNPVVAPSLPCNSLIGKIGKDGTAFEVGASFGFGSVPTSGELYLGVNDGYFGDNTLGWTATLTTSHCSSYWNVDASKISISVDPSLSSEVLPDPKAGGSYLYVFSGEHIGRYPSPAEFAYVLNASDAITLKSESDAALGGNLVYVQNLTGWSGSATYGEKGNTVEEYAAELAPGSDLPVLDAGSPGQYRSVGFVPYFDSPAIHVPVLDADQRPLTKVSYSKGFTTYVGCYSPTTLVFHSLATVSWHVLYYGSVSVPEKSGAYVPGDAVFTPNSGAAVYHGAPQTTLPLPQPVTGAPIANCVAGYQNPDPSTPYEGNPDCTKMTLR